MKINENQWKLMKINENPWKSMSGPPTDHSANWLTDQPFHHASDWPPVCNSLTNWHIHCHPTFQLSDRLTQCLTNYPTNCLSVDLLARWVWTSTPKALMGSGLVDACTIQHFTCINPHRSILIPSLCPKKPDGNRPQARNALKYVNMETIRPGIWKQYEILRARSRV